MTYLVYEAYCNGFKTRVLITKEQLEAEGMPIEDYFPKTDNGVKCLGEVQIVDNEGILDECMVVKDY